MIFQSKMPQKYWVETFFTGNFLSNLLPSTTQNNHSPYESLFGSAPVYTSLRVFGCACFPTLRDYADNKFDPRSLQCIFLGYNDIYKGYRCLLPTTGRVYISRHVLLMNTLFPSRLLMPICKITDLLPLYQLGKRVFVLLPLQHQDYLLLHLF